MTISCLVLHVGLEPALLKLMRVSALALFIRGRTLDIHVQLDALKEKKLAGVGFCVIEYRDKNSSTIYIFSAF